MIHHKKFTQPSALVKFLNENPIYSCLSVVLREDKFVLIYEGPEKELAEGEEHNRFRIIKEKIATGMDYSEDTKRQLGYALKIRKARVVPFTRIKNSIRNLKAFLDYDVTTLAAMIREVVSRDEDLHLLNSEQAKGTYGVRCALIGCKVDWAGEVE